MKLEDDAWAQTLITVTPEEDATLREISDMTTLSATAEVQLHINPDDIVYRRSFTQEVFLDARSRIEIEEEIEEKQANGKEVEEVEKRDAENQTYLQGTPIVHISIEYQDEGSQTMYMSTPCPPLNYYKDIMTSMIEGPMPTVKKSNVVSTIISIDPETPHVTAMEQLFTEITDKERDEFESKLSEQEETEMEAYEIVQFAVARAFWINDPSSQATVETADKSTQTSIKFNNRCKMFAIDSETQTDLSCEPKQSNSMLLSDYWETKNMISSYLDEWINKGIEVRILVDEIIEEIVDKSAERIKYPMKEQMIQTIATYKLDLKEKEADVLRKLKQDIIVDPLEASIIVIPLMDDLLKLVCKDVSKNAVKAATYAFDGVIQRTMTIITKLIQLEKEVKRKPIDEILAKRKKKIRESMSKKETETIGTQTSIAAISEVKKIKKSKEVLCSVCRRQSMCQWCLDRQEGEDSSKEEAKILRTEDILLAYKPCYIVTKISEKDDNLEPPCPPDKGVKSASKYKARSPVGSIADCCDTIQIFFKSEKGIEHEESINEWSYVTDATIMKPCSMKESVTSSSQTTITLLNQSIGLDSASYCSTLTSQEANALQILKETFCRDNCITSSLQTIKDFSSTEDEETFMKSTCTCSSINNADSKFRQEMISQQTSKGFSNLYDTYSICSHIPIRSYGDGFKVIPIHLSQDSCT